MNKALFTLCTLLSSATLVANSAAAHKSEIEIKKRAVECKQITITIKSPLRATLDHALQEQPNLEAPIKDLIEHYATELPVEKLDAQNSPLTWWKHMQAKAFATGKHLGQKAYAAGTSACDTLLPPGNRRRALLVGFMAGVTTVTTILTAAPLLSDIQVNTLEGWSAWNMGIRMP